MDQGEMERVRELAQALVQRLKNDAAFRQQVQENPVTTLTAAGLPDVAVSAFLQHIEPDVVGYMTYGECAITRAWP